MLISCRGNKKKPVQKQTTLFKSGPLCVSTFDARGKGSRDKYHQICYSFFWGRRFLGKDVVQIFEPHSSPEVLEQVFLFLIKWFPTNLGEPPTLIVQGKSKVYLKFKVPRVKIKRKSLLAWLSLLRTGWEFAKDADKQNKSPAEIVLLRAGDGHKAHSIGYSYNPETFSELYAVLKAVKNNEYEDSSSRDYRSSQTLTDTLLLKMRRKNV